MSHSLLLEVKKVDLELFLINVTLTVTDLLEYLIPLFIVSIASVESNHLHIAFEVFQVDVIILSIWSFEIDHILIHSGDPFYSIQIPL